MAPPYVHNIIAHVRLCSSGRDKHSKRTFIKTELWWVALFSSHGIYFGLIAAKKAWNSLSNPSLGCICLHRDPFVLCMCVVTHTHTHVRWFPLSCWQNDHLFAVTSCVCRARKTFAHWKVTRTHTHTQTHSHLWTIVPVSEHGNHEHTTITSQGWYFSERLTDGAALIN